MGVGFRFIKLYVEEYEEKYYPVPMPTLSEIIRYEMAERSITQKELSEMLGVSPSRVSEYTTGKAHTEGGQTSEGKAGY